jgi:hypothetical protein
MKYKFNLRTCASVLALQVAVAGVISSEASASDPLTEMFLSGTLKCTPKVAQYVATAKTVEELSERAQEAAILRTQPEDLQQAYIEERKVNPQASREHIIENITGGPAIRQFFEATGLDFQDNALRSAARLVKQLGVDLDLQAVDLINAAKNLLEQPGVNPTRLSQIAAWLDATNPVDPQAQQSIIYLCRANLEADNHTIPATTYFRGEGINNPTEDQITVLGQADIRDRASIIYLAKININDFSPENINATKRCLEDLHIDEPTVDQINGAKAFIAAGKANPDEAQINAWVDHEADRAIIVALATENVDITVPDNINAAKAFIAAGKINPSADQINAWVAAAEADRVAIVALARANVDIAVADNIAAAKAFIAAGKTDPSVDQINSWRIGNARERDAIVHLVRFNIEDVDDYVDATVAARDVIADPNIEQIKAAKAFIAAGKADPDEVLINAWVNRANDRDAIVALARRNLDVTDADNIAAAKAFIAAGKAEPTADQLNAWVNQADDRDAIVALARRNLDVTDADNIAAAKAFIAVGKAEPTAEQINAWVNRADDRDAIVALARENVDITVANNIVAAKAFIAGDTAEPTAEQIEQWVNTRAAKRPTLVQLIKFGIEATDGNYRYMKKVLDLNIENPSLEQFEAAKAFIDGGVVNPTADQIDAWVDAADAAARAAIVEAAVQP